MNGNGPASIPAFHLPNSGDLHVPEDAAELAQPEQDFLAALQPHVSQAAHAAARTALVEYNDALAGDGRLARREHPRILKITHWSMIGDHNGQGPAIQMRAEVPGDPFTASDEPASVSIIAPLAAPHTAINKSASKHHGKAHPWQDISNPHLPHGTKSPEAGGPPADDPSRAVATDEHGFAAPDEAAASTANG